MFYVSGLVKYNSMRASSYLPLPKKLKAKQGCFSIQNNDEKCFIWSILASLHLVQRRNHQFRVLKYQEYERELIKYPVYIKDISKFGHQNNISVNVYGCEDKKIFLLRITTMTAASHHVNLLYITLDETSHYVLVKDLSRLVSSQYNNHKNETYFYQYYLHGCTSEEVLKKGFIKTTDHRPIHPPTTYHLPTDPPTTYPPTHRLTIINIVKIEDQILNLFCTL